VSTDHARLPELHERLEELDAQRLIYRLLKLGPHGRTQLILSPLQLLERIAALLPPPRQHRHGLASTVPAIPGARSVAMDTPARTSCPGVRHAAFAHWANGHGSPQRAFAYRPAGLDHKSGQNQA